VGDVLTGSQAGGTGFTGADDRTCKNWTSSTQGAAMVGHLDRRGLNADAPASDPSRTWNSAHLSRGPDGGCSQPICAAPVGTDCSIASLLISCPIERDIATAACASLRQKAAYYWPSMSGYRELASRPPLNYDIKKSLPRLNALSMSS
jgi:hypothetical protein